MAVETPYVVLFALPTDQATFDAVVHGGMLPDYRRLLVGDGVQDEALNDRCGRLAAAAQDVMAAARQLGAHVVEHATMPDVASIGPSAQVIILVGHWRGSTVLHDDLRAGTEEIVARLAAGGLEGLFDRSAIDDGDFLSHLNDAIDSGAVFGRACADLGQDDSPALKAALGRDVIDEILGAAIVQGNRVELWDGLHDPGTFESALHPQFHGALDLATCNSIVLATLISRRRKAQVRVVHTVESIDPLTCLFAIARTLRRVINTGEGYLNARLVVEAELLAIKRGLKRARRR